MRHDAIHKQWRAYPGGPIDPLVLQPVARRPGTGPQLEMGLLIGLPLSLALWTGIALVIRALL
jgi:hypothetical protein